MQVEQTFTVHQPLDRVWQFFVGDVERVTRCVPGIEDFEDLGEDRYRVRFAQRLGHIGATFDLKAQLERQEATRSLKFSAAGRSVKGAAGDLRSLSQLHLEAESSGDTRCTVTSDITLSGMLASLGHRMVLAKAREVTDDFVRNVTAEMEQ